MSFRCGRCGKKVARGIPPVKQVVETKKVIHTDYYVMKEDKKISVPAGTPFAKVVQTPGTQIVKEINVGPCCL